MHNMRNFRRTMWAATIFTVMLAPFVILFFITLRAPRPSRAALAAQQGPSSQEAPAFPSILLNPPPPPVTAVGSAQDASLLASGDGKTLWVIHPVLFEDKDKKTPSYELLARSSNSNTWSQRQSERGVYFSGFPRGLATIGHASAQSPASAYVFTDGFITRFSLSDHALINRPLPPDQTLLAETGGTDEMFAITSGPQPPVAPTTTQSGDANVPPINDIDLATIENVAQTQPASQPGATTIAASQPQPPPSINSWWYHDDQWVLLPPLSGGNGKSIDGSSPGSAITIAVKSGRLIALWAESTSPTVLNSRSIEYARPAPHWSGTAVTHLDQPLPADIRLLPVVLDDSLYVFWPVVNPNTVWLRGGRLITDTQLSTDLTLPTANLLPPLNLGNAVGDQSPSAVAIGPAENSLAVIVSGEKGALSCQLFNKLGQPLGKMTPVTIKSPPRDLQIVQNIAMLLLVLMIALSLWQWRQKPTALKLPEGMAAAPLPLRGFAFLIDIAIPFILVTATLGTGDYGSMLTAWTDSFSNPEELINSPVLIYTLGLYLLHVTLGELFLRRSIGKAILGLQVLMIDGRSPTVAAILLRNLVRIPELLPGVLIIYLLVSDTHQRLGDLLARTLVVSNKAPETPADPDTEEKKEALAAPKKEKLK